MQGDLGTAFTILSVLLGLVCGSFINVIAYRIPRRESILRPGSRCPSCGHPLSARELIPIISFMVLKGRCRWCRDSISVRYPVLELTTALLFALSYLHFSTWPTRLAWDAFWILLVALMGTDLTSMRVPNVLSYPGALLMFVLSVVTGIQSWSNALWGAVTGFTLIFVVHLLSRGNMGMGDAKLYLSIGAMLGPFYTVESFVLASLSGAVIGVLLRVSRLIGQRALIPFVPHIVIGVALTVFSGQALTFWYLHRVLGFA